MSVYEERLQQDLNTLRGDVAAAAESAALAVEASVRALLHRDRQGAAEVILGDLPINRATRAVEARFGRQHGCERPLIDVLAPSIHADRRIREIEGDAGGVVDREAHRLRRRVTQAQPDFENLAWQRLNVDCLELPPRSLGHGG